MEIREIDERKIREIIPYEPNSSEDHKGRKKPKMIKGQGKGKQGKISMLNKLVGKHGKMAILVKLWLCDLELPKKWEWNLEPLGITIWWVWQKFSLDNINNILLQVKPCDVNVNLNGILLWELYFDSLVCQNDWCKCNNVVVI